MRKEVKRLKKHNKLLVEPKLVLQQKKVDIQWRNLDKPYTLEEALEQIGLLKYAQDRNTTLRLNKRATTKLWKEVVDTNSKFIRMVDPYDETKVTFFPRRFPYLEHSVEQHLEAQLYYYINMEHTRFWWRKARIETYKQNPRSKISELKLDF